MTPRSGRLAAATAIGLSLSFGLAACSGQGSQAGGDPGWTTGDSVIAGVTDAGFDCSFDTDQELSQIITKNPWTKEELGGQLVLCQGFQVFLVGEMSTYFDSLKGDCAAVTEEELNSEAMDRKVVIGSNFVIAGTGENQAFPEEYGPADFAQAFGGSERSLGSIYEEVCPDLSPA